MIPNKKEVPILELKRLLYDLYDRQPYTCIRIRLLGEMWQRNFFRVFKISGLVVIFFNEASGRLLKISNLANIVQFEIDHNFQHYQAHFHYDVIIDDYAAS